jgi:catechol 2,3-dioxygenase-like lactoylglutathione lyase family enzyme
MKNLILLIVLLGFCLSVTSCSEPKNQVKNPANKKEEQMSTISIRYMIDDVPAALKFYTTHLGFAVDMDASPAFASITRDGVRLLLSGKTSSGRRAMPDGREPVPGGWNRIHIQVEDLAAEVERLRGAGLNFRNDIITGPGGSQIILDDPSGNPVELFQPTEKR